MTFKRFTPSDLFYNTVVTHPEYQFIVQNGKTYINRESEKTGNFSNKLKHVTQGHISLYEININRPADTEDKTNLAYPFTSKDSSRSAFRTVTTSQFQDSSQFQFGDVIKGAYPLSASINRIFVKSGIEFDIHNFDDPTTDALPNKKYIRALRNSIEANSFMSKYYFYSSSLSDSPSVNASAYKGSSNVNLVCVPSIFYGSEIKKGSIQLDYYVTGALCAQLKDSKKNGELIETVGPNEGKVAGVVLYEQGFFVLTGSYNLPTTYTQDFFGDGAIKPTWLTFGSGLKEIGQSSGYVNNSKCTHLISIKGTNKIPTLTMLAHAKRGELNYSQNPTFCKHENPITSSTTMDTYEESPGTIKNIKKSKYKYFEESYEGIVYITKIGIYDEDKNLIAVASLANPVKKTEIRDYTFKLKMDF